MCHRGYGSPSWVNQSLISKWRSALVSLTHSIIVRDKCNRIVGPAHTSELVLLAAMSSGGWTSSLTFFSVMHTLWLLLILCIWKAKISERMFLSSVPHSVCDLRRTGYQGSIATILWYWFPFLTSYCHCFLGSPPK